MSEPIYNWLIVFDDGVTERVEADNPIEALEKVDWHYYGVRAVLRMDYVR